MATGDKGKGVKPAPVAAPGVDIAAAVKAIDNAENMLHELRKQFPAGSASSVLCVNIDGALFEAMAHLGQFDGE